MPRSLRIAMLAPISWRTPPRHYGPWELATSLLTEELVRRGHQVTLFATADSVTTAKLNAVCPSPYSEDPTIDAKVWEAMHIANCFEQADNFDIIHNQADFVPLAFSRLTATPVVTTIHGFSSEHILPIYQEYQNNVHYVAISESDRHPDLRYAATIHHGIDLDDFPMASGSGDYVLFFGRIHPDKGTAEAISAARTMGMRLIIAGIIQDQDYFDKEVKPHLAEDRIEYVGSVGGTERAHLLGQANVLLHLVNFDEPFGFSVAEAMACGTPVIAVRRGSMPELIEDGVTGVLVDSMNDVPVAMQKALTLDRKSCRAHVEKRFHQGLMAENYEQLYIQIVDS